MKRMAACALVCVIVLSVGTALCEGEYNKEYDLSSMSVEELLTLRNAVNQELEEKDYTVYYEISHGDKGENVILLQQRLTELGYYSGSINGKYTTQTQKAVKKYQKDNGLDGNGVATIETQITLFENSETEETTESADAALEDYEEFDYTKAVNDPDGYTDTKVAISGTAVQVTGTRASGVKIRLATKDGYGDIVYVTLPKTMDISVEEGDEVSVYGVMTGMKTYTSAYKLSITIPSATAEQVILR